MTLPPPKPPMSRPDEPPAAAARGADPGPGLLGRHRHPVQPAPLAVTQGVTMPGQNPPPPESLDLTDKLGAFHEQASLERRADFPWKGVATAPLSVLTAIGAAYLPQLPEGLDPEAEQDVLESETHGALADLVMCAASVNAVAMAALHGVHTETTVSEALGILFASLVEAAAHLDVDLPQALEAALRADYEDEPSEGEQIVAEAEAARGRHEATDTFEAGGPTSGPFAPSPEPNDG